MDVLPPERLDAVRQLLKQAKHMAIATVNADGTPHNTPIFFAFNGTLDRLYWCSSPDSLHSKNVERTGQLFAVIYDSSIGGGLYIKASEGAELSDAELELAIATCNVRRRQFGATDLEVSDYVGGAAQRIYGATVQALTINFSQKDASGRIRKDTRYPITAQDLL